MTQAIAAFGIQFRLGNGVALAPLSITNATNATPIVVTTSIAHGVVDLSYATVAGVLGNLGANGSFIVERVSANQLKLRRSAGSGAYTSGGTVTIDSTYTVVAEVTDFADLGATAQLVDTTAHDATNRWGSRIPTFLDTGNMRVSLNHVPTNPTHDATTGLWYLFANRTRRPVLIVLPDSATAALKTAWHFTCAVSNWSEALPVNGVLSAQIGLTGMGDLVLAKA